MDLPLLCCTFHTSDIEACESCTNNHELSVGLVDLNKKLYIRRKAKEMKVEKLKALIAVTEEKLKFVNDSDNFTEDKFAPQKGIPLTDYLLTINLPQDFFTIITREDLTVAFMVQSKFLSTSQTCKQCQTEMPITYFANTSYVYYCFICKTRNKIKSTTLFQGSPLSLEKILLFIFLWVLGLRDVEISNLLEVSKPYTSTMSRKIRQLVGEDFSKSPPQFSGVVEISEMDFIKRKIEIGKSKAVKKWVIVMVERVTKQAYMEYIPERKKEVIIPIIQRLCLPGTVIITKQWAGYGRLEDLGYCHYTYEKIKGFIDPKNPHIHHSHVKNAFIWLKYQIKTRNRAGNFLQEYILEWLWRKRHSVDNKADNSSVSIFKAVLAMLSNSKF